MLYFRKIPDSKPTYHATTSSGAWFAEIVKQDLDDESSWSVSFGRSKESKPLFTKLTLENSFEVSINHLAITLDEGKPSQTKRTKNSG